MKTKGFNRRKFLQVGGALAAVGTIAPVSYGASLLVDEESILAENNTDVRLFSNENPYGPSQKVLDTISKHTNRVNRYASYHEYDTYTLKKTIAERNRIKDDQVILGHGSFEILCMLTRAFGKKQNGIIVPAVTFNVTATFADRIFDHKAVRIPLTKSMDIDLNATKDAVTKETKLVYICNPNNPTGKRLPVKELESFCKEVSSTSCTVAIDEAYIELTDPRERPDTIQLLIEKYNVLIIRTFSKAYGLAGLRVGYAMGLAETIKLLSSEYYSFGGLISNPGVVAAITALKDSTYVDIYRKRNFEVRSFVEKRLEKMGIEYLESNTNFILMNVKDLKRFRADLKASGIATIPGGWDNYPSWARVSIGTLSEMKFFAKAVAELHWLKA